MKRICSLVCCVVVLLIVTLSFAACGTSIQEEWGTIFLGSHLPTPQEGKLNSGSNLDDLFMGSIDDVESTYFVKYKKACIDMGYMVESEESGDRYEAYNAEGYELSLSYYSNKLHITLHAPLELTEIEWPQSGVGAKLPIPASSMGKITSDSSNSFAVTIGNTDKDAYRDYVKACEDNGFIEDYHKTEDRYEAKDAEGYRLVVRYVGNNKVEIMIQTPKEDTAQNETTPPTENTTLTTEETTPTTEPVTNDDSSKLIRDEFKEAMDSYECFMDEYVTFMKKYKENPTDMSMINDYTTFLTKYAEFMDDFGKWGDKDLNTAETNYYLEVQVRVNKKLLEVA